MDMKKILQAFDNASSGKLSASEGIDDMKKFVSIVKGLPQEANLQDSVGSEANAFLLSADKINDEVMGQIEKIKINADPDLLKELMDKFNSFMSSYHAVGKEILQPDLFKDDASVEEGDFQIDRTELKSAHDKGYADAAKGISKSPYNPNSPADKSYREGQMSYKRHFGIGEGAEEELEKIEQHPEADDPEIKKAIQDKKKELAAKSEGVKNGLPFKDYFALEEAKKKISAGDDPCWKGYKMVGTKKKGGKEVPNCVPGKKGD
jgi:hypothetical protein